MRNSCFSQFDTTSGILICSKQAYIQENHSFLSSCKISKHTECTYTAGHKSLNETFRLPRTAGQRPDALQALNQTYSLSRETVNFRNNVHNIYFRIQNVGSQFYEMQMQRAVPFVKSRQAQARALCRVRAFGQPSVRHIGYCFDPRLMKSELSQKRNRGLIGCAFSKRNTKDQQEKKGRLIRNKSLFSRELFRIFSESTMKSKFSKRVTLFRAKLSPNFNLTSIKQKML